LFRDSPESRNFSLPLAAFAGFFGDGKLQALDRAAQADSRAVK
jgi:hypothetical protein